MTDSSVPPDPSRSPPSDPAKASDPRREAAVPSGQNLAADPPRPVPQQPAVSNQEVAALLRDVLTQLSKKKRLPDWINGAVCVIAGCAAILSFLQFRIADRAINGTYLLQLTKDNKEISEYASKAPDIRYIVDRQCTEPRGDLDYDAAHTRAVSELDHILDFYEFYAIAYADHGLISANSWNEVCRGAATLSRSNCFYKAEWTGALSRRDSQVQTTELKLCGAVP